MKLLRVAWQRLVSLVWRKSEDDEYTSEWIAVGRRPDKTTYKLYAREDKA